jgi:hypothetical protein
MNGYECGDYPHFHPYEVGCKKVPRPPTRPNPSAPTGGTPGDVVVSAIALGALIVTIVVFFALAVIL